MKRSLTVQNASVRTVVLELAKRFNTNVALPEDLRGFVTASLHDVTLEQALTAVLTPLGYQFTRKNGIVIVSRAVATMGPTTSGSRAPVVIALTYITPERAANALRSLFSEAGIRPDRSANAVIVTGSAEDVQQIRSVMQSLDVRSPLTPLVEAIQLRTTDAC